MVDFGFFRDLPPMKRLQDITDESFYQNVPSDWHIALTDVVNSTIAIQKGHYKIINTITAATIAAILNSLPNIELPFLFGGDGAFVIIPPQVLPQVQEALAAVRHLSRKNFNLEVRAGIVPVQDVLNAGYRVKVGKLQISDHFMQPVFTGGGLDYADFLLKDEIKGQKYQVEANPQAQADFSGFECRWSKHPARHEEVVSLIVKAVHPDNRQHPLIYTKVIDAIAKIYGDEQQRYPLDIRKMRVATNPFQYRNELVWKTSYVTVLAILKLMLWTIGGATLWMYKKIWPRYKAMVLQTTDHEKFDDTLRLTMSGTKQQRQQLQAVLEDMYQSGDIVYGLHQASHSLMTCIVYERFGRQVHFVDADKGGYALAAHQMKAQLQMLNPNDLVLPS
ncbi:MAG: DUF3095 domain-containing protein [Chloroflexi bacterium]|nr:MAG: DUF3095 domain-containing protein [Chloroflexota bacterium]